jgi:hypothetical protein
MASCIFLFYNKKFGKFNFKTLWDVKRNGRYTLHLYESLKIKNFWADKLFTL